MSRLIVPLALVLLLLTVPTSAQSSSALINEALDKLVSLKIEQKTPLPQVMRSITNDTGVPLEADPVVWELLPWGEDTGVAATFEQVTLRQALEALTRELGLTFVLTEQAVQIRPMPALRRLGRRATIDEIAVLKLLDTTPAGLAGEHVGVGQLLETVDSKLQQANSKFAVENRAFDQATGQTPVPIARNFSLLQALETIPRATGATWYPWGDTLVVLPKADHVRMQLGKTISARFNGTDLSQVLSELSQRSGVAFTIEPGAVQRVAPELRTVRLILDNTTVQQALENIAGFTGLGYVVNDQGVYLWNQSANPIGGPGGRDRAIGLIEIEGGIQVLVPQSQVPPDLQEYLKHRTQRALDSLRQQMEEEGFQPTTAPTGNANEDL